MKRTLRTGGIEIVFNIMGSPHSAIAKNCKYEFIDGKITLYFDISSKANLDMNQDADSILNYLEKIDTVEISDDYYLNLLRLNLDQIDRSQFQNIKWESQILFPENKTEIRIVEPKFDRMRLVMIYKKSKAKKFIPKKSNFNMNPNY